MQHGSQRAGAAVCAKKTLHRRGILLSLHILACKMELSVGAFWVLVTTSWSFSSATPDVPGGGSHDDDTTQRPSSTPSR